MKLNTIHIPVADRSEGRVASAGRTGMLGVFASADAWGTCGLLMPVYAVSGQLDERNITEPPR